MENLDYQYKYNAKEYQDELGLDWYDYGARNYDANTYGSYLLFNKNNKTDAGWTGGIVLNVGGVEAGYQNFSGYWPEFGSKGTEYGYKFSAENSSTGNGAYHQSLNRAFNFVRKDNVNGGVFSGAWFQNWIHKNISDDGKYIYI